METKRKDDSTQRDYLQVQAARDKGDERAYADLVRYYREPIYLMLLRMTHNPTEADDLTMDTFGKAFRHLSTYTPQNSFSTWLFAIASNNGIDFIRRRRMDIISLSEVMVHDDDGRSECTLPSEDKTPEEELIGRQRRMIVRSVVNQLKPCYRQIVELRYFEELSYEEIAQRLRLPLGTVKIQLRRARMRLSEIMQIRGEFYKFNV